MFSLQVVNLFHDINLKFLDSYLLCQVVTVFFLYFFQDMNLKFQDANRNFMLAMNLF